MSNGRWTSEDTATLERMACAGYTDQEIADHTGHCRATVQRQRAARQMPTVYEAPIWRQSVRARLIRRLTFKVATSH